MVWLPAPRRPHHDPVGGLAGPAPVPGEGPGEVDVVGVDPDRLPHVVDGQPLRRPRGAAAIGRRRRLRAGGTGVAGQPVGGPAGRRPRQCRRRPGTQAAGKKRSPIRTAHRHPQLVGPRLANQG